MANQSVARPKSSNMPQVLACLVLGVVAVFHLGVIALEKREARALATADKVCGGRSMTAKRVGRDIVCVARDGQPIALPKKTS